MYYLLFIFILIVSCSNNQDKNLVDVEYYIKQGKEISFKSNTDFLEISKISKLQLSPPETVNKWLSNKINNSNYLPRFNLDIHKNKISTSINANSFLAINKNIYVTNEHADLIVLNEDLKVLKKKTIYKKKEFEDYNLIFSMTSDGQLIYISDNLGNIHAIEIDTLNIKWSLKLGVPIKSNLYLNKGDLFFINSNSKIYSIKTSNGQINWSYENPSKILKEQYQILISKNLLLITNDYGEIYCYDLSKQNLFWKINLSNVQYQTKRISFKAAYPVSNDGIIYFSSNYGETISIEESTGKIAWRKSISSTNVPIVNNNYVFLINKKGFFYILNKKNGDLLYSKDINKINLNKNKTQTIYYGLILGKDYIYFMNSGKNLIKININDLSSIQNDEHFIDNAKDFFVFNDYLYFLENKKISKFYK